MDPTTLSPQEPIQPTATPVPLSAPAKLQAHVDYLPGITIFGATSALLEWSADDRIKFFKMDSNTNQATEVLFDVPYGQIESVSGSMVMLTFKVAGKKYNAQFSRTAMAGLGVGGVVGIAVAANRSNASGINEWLEMFKQHNVNTNGFKGLGWSVKWGLIITGIILVVVVVIALTTYR
ncbi:MAG: hypothetical protein ABIP50_01545 [Candidatus Saccharimonadales bacterium]